MQEMSRRSEEEQQREEEGEDDWGPSHQHKDPPTKESESHIPSTIAGVLVLLFLLGLARLFVGNFVGVGSESLFGWAIVAVVVVFVGRGLLTTIMVALTRPPRAPVHPNPRTAWPTPRGEDVEPYATPAALARERVQRAGGGAYLGIRESGEWAVAHPEHGIGIVGGPRSGKSTAFIIPGIDSASGAVVSTSTKPDVMKATLSARSEVGQAWLFDPYGEEQLPEGVRRLHWSPVTAATTWDQALLMAGAMTAAARPGAGTTNESHWKERSEALLAPMLYAANQSGRTIGDVSEWVLSRNLAPVFEVLADCDAPFAIHVLKGIQETDSRERSSILSAAAGVLAAYRSDAVRASAANPNFDPIRFARGTDTIYITSAEQYQLLTAPLIVGLLEQIRQAVYYLAARGEMPEWMKWYLDEFTNMAPIADPLSLISQAGGQKLQVVLGFQDMAQIRARYSDAVADGFMTLLQTIVLLSGTRDTRTLETISTALGEYDRQVVSQSLGHSEPQEFMSTATHSDNVSYQTQRQRVLPPGEIAKLPKGQALLLESTNWELVTLTEWFKTEPWLTIAGPDAL